MSSPKCTILNTLLEQPLGGPQNSAPASRHSLGEMLIPSADSQTSAIIVGRKVLPPLAFRQSSPATTVDLHKRFVFSMSVHLEKPTIASLAARTAPGTKVQILCQMYTRIQTCHFRPNGPLLLSGSRKA